MRPPPLADDSGEAARAGAPLTLTLGFELEDDEESDSSRATDDEDEDDDADLGQRRPTRTATSAEAEAEPLHDPGAVRRYRFKHPTASGKTDRRRRASSTPPRITGVLILTHRRLLVDQFKRDLTKQGYGERMPRGRSSRGKRGPTTPPVTIETYAWFIQQRRAAEPRRLRRGRSATRRTRRWARSTAAAIRALRRRRPTSA